MPGRDSQQHATATLPSPEEWNPLWSFIENSSDAMFVLDSGGRFLWLNPRCETLTGYPESELRRLGIAELLPPESRERVDAALRHRLASPEPMRLEVEIGSRSGAPITLETRSWLESGPNGSPVIHAIARDITDSKRREERVRQAERVQALSLLAGGVAHDFNNLLMTIVGHADQLRQDAGEFEALREAAELIQRTAQRGIEISSRLLESARGAKPVATEIDLHATLRDVIGLLRQTLGPVIRVSADLAAAESTVLADSAQMYQVFLNLALNAKDAMPEGGEIAFLTQVVEEPSGRTLWVDVRDTGTGIPADILGRIFEPFFTTKAPEKGTGMGLAVVNGIVKNHRGRVQVESSASGGTTFHVCLPLAGRRNGR